MIRVLPRFAAGAMAVIALAGTFGCSSRPAAQETCRNRGSELTDLYDEAMGVATDSSYEAGTLAETAFNSKTTREERSAVTQSGASPLRYGTFREQYRDFIDILRSLQFRKDTRLPVALRKTAQRSGVAGVVDRVRADRPAAPPLSVTSLKKGLRPAAAIRTAARSGDLRCVASP